MNAEEQIKRFGEFLEENYKAELVNTIRKGENFSVIDFSLLSQFDPELAETLLEQPEEIVKAAELAVEQMDLDTKNFRIRINNLSESQRLMIRNVRSKHLGKLLLVAGIVRQKSDVRPQVTSAKFECPSCGNMINILQLDTSFKEPSRCGCGRKGKFRLVDKELIDAQGLVLEEDPEVLEGGEQPKRMNVILKEDLVSPLSEKKTNPGSKVSIVGQIKEVPIISRTGSKSTRYDLIVEANNVEGVEETFYDIEITDEEEAKIKELAQDPKVYERLIASIAPSIYGYDRVKEALVLQLMGGSQKTRSDGIISRGDIHVLLVGDPGAGKSQLLKRVNIVAPKGRYVSGKGVSGAGITAAVVRDEFLRGWSLEAGALVLASNGICCLHKDVEVIKDNRIVKIKDLFNKNKKEFGKVKGDIIELNSIKGVVQSLDKKRLKIKEGSVTKIRRKRHEGKLLNIKLESGFSIKLTPDHMVINGNTLKWKRIGEFKIGDSLVAPLKNTSSDKDIYLIDIMPLNWKVGLDKKEKNLLKEEVREKFNTLSGFNRHFNLDRAYLSGNKQFTVKKFKEIISFLGGYKKWKGKPLKYIRNKNGERLKIYKMIPELGYLLGFIFGDGYVKITKRRTIINVYQSVKNKKQTDKFIKCWEKVFEKRPGTYVRNVTEGKIKAIVNMFYHGSNLLGSIYEKYIGRSLSNILQLPDPVLKAFIAGAMDSDGCISTKKGLKFGKIYKTQHVEFLLSNDDKANLNFILALRRLDCYGKLIRLNNKLSSIRITGRRDVLAIREAIKDYSVKMADTMVLPKISDISSVSDKLPLNVVAEICHEVSKLNKSFLLKKGIWSYIYEFKSMRRRPSRNQLNKIKERCGSLLDKEVISKINPLLNRDFFLDKIIKIEEEDYDGYVYDLFIPEHHNFVANGIIVHNCIDEIDKMNPEDRGAMHEALEQQTISISKANIQATLLARTTVLAAANPKLGRFDPYAILATQIDLPPTLINRFDLIFPIKDLPNEKEDEKMASHILNLHQTPDIKEPEIPTKLLRKYFAYARQNIKPILTDGAVKEIKDYYVGVRSKVTTEETGVRAIPISPRQLEAAVRLAEASARVRLADKVTRKDARRAINILNYCLREVGLDRETGEIDIDRISTGIPATERSKIVVVRELITELESRLGKTIPIDDVMREASDKGLDEAEIEDAIEKLKRSGDLFEPRRGFLSRI